MDEDVVDYGEHDDDDDILPGASLSQYTDQTSHLEEGLDEAAHNSPSLASQPPVGTSVSVGSSTPAYNPAYNSPSLTAMNNMAAQLLQTQTTLQQQLAALRTSVPTLVTTSPAATGAGSTSPGGQPLAVSARRTRKPSTALTSATPHHVHYMVDTCLEPGPASRESASSRTTRLESNTVRLEQLIHRCIEELEQRLTQDLCERINSAALDTHGDVLKKVIQDLRQTEERLKRQYMSLKSEILDAVRADIKQSQEELWSRMTDLIPTRAIQDLTNTLALLNQSSGHPPLQPLTSSSLNPLPPRSPSGDFRRSRSRSRSGDSACSRSFDSPHPRSPRTPPLPSLAHRLTDIPTTSSKRKRSPYSDWQSKRNHPNEGSSVGHRPPPPSDRPTQNTLRLSRPPDDRPFSSTINRAFDMYYEWASTITRHTNNRVRLPKPVYITRPQTHCLTLYFYGSAAETFYSVWTSHRHLFADLGNIQLSRDGTA
ncbi:hypothetical protein C8R42DRAFT_391368 [Lentinula raphanica]|nr:hypothetical protein C8R42DRAFT_391368 [Lentinula raphanica]